MSIEDKFLEITQKDLDTMWTKTQESARNFARTYYLTPSGQVVLRSEAFPSKKWPTAIFSLVISP